MFNTLIEKVICNKLQINGSTLVFEEGGWKHNREEQCSCLFYAAENKIFILLEQQELWMSRNFVDINEKLGGFNSA